MYLKRLYDDQDDPRLCTGVQVIHTGLSPEQNFSRRLVMQAISDGWMTLVGNELTINATPELLRYEVLREPGYYCSSTGERIPISDLARQQALTQPVATLACAEAKAWLATKGKGSSDYEVTNAYECRLNAEQHEKYRAVSEGGIVRAARDVQEV